MRDLQHVFRAVCRFKCAIKRVQGATNYELLIINTTTTQNHNLLRQIFESSKFRHKIHAIAGDCMLPGLGMTSMDKNLLVKNVSGMVVGMLMNHTI